jgi:pimeloyl-ACP methyl ester carboxylesterase
MKLVKYALGALCVAVFALPASAEEVVKLKPRGDVVLKLLVDAPADAKALALLLPGGHGKVNIQNDGTFKGLKGNFLVRSRDLFVGNGVATAVFDAPSDRKDSEGLSYSYRVSAEHADDIKAAIAELRGKYPKLPIWLVGTSRGSTSAANAAANIKEGGTDGVVLTASVGVSSKHGGNVLDFDLAGIKIPVLVVHHEEDGCKVTPVSGARDIKAALTGAKASELIVVTGGDSGGEPCKGKSHHGFLGIENKVVDAIATWIKSH